MRVTTAILPMGNPADILAERHFVPPARRYNDETGGSFAQKIVFGCYDYVFRSNSFIIYLAEGSEGGMMKPTYIYILVEDLNMEGKAAAQQKADDLIVAGLPVAQELHDEVLVFDNGFWQKSKELSAEYPDGEVGGRYLGEEEEGGYYRGCDWVLQWRGTYQEFGVPWKVFDTLSDWDVQY